ncbi:MAG: SixA phosphatase family protein [Petrimonas sp.]|jgi:phosphohistidine phosphatase|nr:MAG: phosphohistidine phosphatase [Bacteroidetes bacterium ADurb.BinA174]
MKKLLIMRHGKSSWNSEYLDDYDRPLNDRGKKNSSEMGHFLLQVCGKPELILASAAKRTTETAIRAALNLNYPQDKIEFDRELYLAGINDILKSISKISANVNTCILVGHNPGLTDLVNYFGLRLDNLPTASVVCLDFDAPTWKEISPKNARFQWLKLAREL